MDKSAAIKSVMNWVKLHPTNIAQKVQIIIEHFRENVGPRLPRGHIAAGRTASLTLRDLANEPLIIYPSAPRPSYADPVLGFYRDNGIEPQVAFEVRELQTALGGSPRLPESVWCPTRFESWGVETSFSSTSMSRG